MTVHTYKINMVGTVGLTEQYDGLGEAYDHNVWDMDCIHDIHIFELLLEQLNMAEDDSILWFDSTKPGDPKQWTMASWNGTFKAVARLVTDEEIAEAESKDKE